MRLTGRSIRVLSLIVGALLIAAPTWAQSTTAPATKPADAGPSKPSKDKGWISGTVIALNGKPAVGLAIRAEKFVPAGMGRGEGGGGGPRIVHTTTDEKGNFTFKELDVATYTLIAGSKEIGWIYREEQPEAGKELQLGEMKLVKI